MLQSNLGFAKTISKYAWTMKSINLTSAMFGNSAAWNICSVCTTPSLSLVPISSLGTPDSWLSIHHPLRVCLKKDILWVSFKTYSPIYRTSALLSNTELVKISYSNDYSSHNQTTAETLKHCIRELNIRGHRNFKFSLVMLSKLKLSVNQWYTYIWGFQIHTRVH